MNTNTIQTQHSDESKPDNERREKVFNSDLLEDFLEKLSSHFVKETKLIKRIDELNNKYSLCKLSLANTLILLTQTQQRYGDDHERTRQVEKELEILRRNDVDFQEKLLNSVQEINQIKDERSNLNKQ